MEMTKGEIITAYRQAKDRCEQIKILAELNACDVEEIEDILGGSAAGVKYHSRRGAPSKIDKCRALSMLANGCTKTEVAREFGCTVAAVWHMEKRYFEEAGVKCRA